MLLSVPIMLIVLGLCCLISATTGQSYSESETVESKKSPGEISKQKCQEYAKYVYEYLPSPILQSENNNSRLIKQSTCGYDDDIIVRYDTRAQIREFPHQALIGYEKTPAEISWLCSGSLISESYIITAAHCLFSRFSGTPKYVKMGISRSNDTSNMQMRKVTQIIKHPDFRPPSVYNDIGLLKLDTGFILNGYVRPACLFTALKIRPQNAIVSGLERQDSTYTISENLVKYTLSLVDTEECNKAYKSHVGNRMLKSAVRDDMQICAVHQGRYQETYVDLSGAPLQIYHRGDDLHCMYDIIGVNSFGRSSLGFYPEVYTRISAYVQWIESVVWA